jgi:hypothetical protein
MRARVRIVSDYDAGAVDPPVRRLFTVGEELTLILGGRAGRPVDDAWWWTSRDIDGAHMVPADRVEVLEIIEHVSPDG